MTTNPTNHQGRRVAAGKYVVRFVGGPMHCYPVPDSLNGMLVVNVRMGAKDPWSQYSLGVLEDDETGERYVFYGFDALDDIDEIEALVATVRYPC